MALINHAKKEINAKIVYFGPAQSGKNTVLAYIYSRIKPFLRGEFKCVPAGADELMFFDFSPFESALPNGYHLRLHIYTLTGTVTNPATWKMTLKGTDGIMILLDPALTNSAEASESVSQLRDFLSAYGVGLHETPAVLQLTSSTREILPDEAAQIAAALDLSALSTCRADAASGEGVLEALTILSRLILDRVALCDEPSAAVKDDAVPSLHVALLPHEVVAEGGTIRIPLTIGEHGALRRLVVTVNVELE
ncbi:MAG TPA: hypothetical protein HPP97_08520 [Desulfuromonadales bacterium]|nr:hypothetical protein [Desulfuromonadales bacterium]